MALVTEKIYFNAAISQKVPLSSGSSYAEINSLPKNADGDLLGRAIFESYGSNDSRFSTVDLLLERPLPNNKADISSIKVVIKAKDIPEVTTANTGSTQNRFKYMLNYNWDTQQYDGNPYNADDIDINGGITLTSTSLQTFNLSTTYLPAAFNANVLRIDDAGNTKKLGEIDYVASYIEVTYDKSAPTTPGAFVSPTGALTPNTTPTIDWGDSTDVNNNLSGYILEASIDGGAFSEIVRRTASFSWTNTYTIPNCKTIQFRVKAYDNTGLESGYRTSSVFTVNTAPNLTLNTSENQTLSESAGQNALVVEGSTNDTNVNDSVTVKMQINDGTIRNIASAISNGSAPITFSRLLTYRDKVIYDGETPISNALAEGTEHKLKVWAVDGAGGISVVAERKFRVIHNRPPVISGTDRNFGTLIESPSIVYQVNDVEANSITITEKINGQVIHTFGAEPNTDYTLEIPLEMWILLQLETHTLTIEATDSAGLTAVRTYTFTRTEDTIQLELKNPFETDIAATRILVTPEVYIPIGATILIEACNNAFDAEPTWEDITSMAMANRGYNFTNTTKTAEKWGINIRFILEKETASQEVRLDGFGGAFE